MGKGNLVVAVGVVVVVVWFCAAVSFAEEAVAHSGAICGTVVDADSGEVIAGAQGV